MLFSINAFFILISSLFTWTNTNQGIDAALSYSIFNKDSLSLSLSLQNNTDENLFLICRIDELTFEEEYIPDRINYGSPIEDIKNSRAKALSDFKSIYKHSNQKDTFSLKLPITENRYQNNYKGKKIDISENLDILRRISLLSGIDTLNYKIDPPKQNVKDNYIDKDAYNLISKYSKLKIDTCYSCYDIIILNPGELKKFDVNLSYLLLDKSIYKITFDFFSNYNNKELSETMKKLGFHQFRGRITSNTIVLLKEK